jgi:hypothetical protein
VERQQRFPSVGPSEQGLDWLNTLLFRRGVSSWYQYRSCQSMWSGQGDTTTMTATATMAPKSLKIDTNVHLQGHSVLLLAFNFARLCVCNATTDRANQADTTITAKARSLQKRQWTRLCICNAILCWGTFLFARLCICKAIPVFRDVGLTRLCICSAVLRSEYCIQF